MKFLMLTLFGYVLGDLMSPISLNMPNFPVVQHPLKPIGNLSAPIQTNKYYTNAMANLEESASNPFFQDPYILIPLFNNGSFAISASEQKTVYDNGKAYWYNQAYDLIIGGEGLTNYLVQPNDPYGFSAQLFWQIGSSRMSLYSVRGSAYVSVQFTNIIVSISTNMAILSFSKDPMQNFYQLSLNNNQTWFIYPVGGAANLNQAGNTIVSSSPYTGWLRFAKSPLLGSSDLALLHSHSGSIVTSVTLSLVSESSYQFTWNLDPASTSTEVLHFAYPHHQDILQRNVTKTNLAMVCATKGIMVAYVGSNTWSLNETPSIDFDFFFPDAPTSNSDIDAIIQNEFISVSNEIPDATKYFFGKQIQKLGHICLVAYKLNNPILQNCIQALSDKLNILANNSFQYPLNYDQVYGGVISTQGLTGDSLNDFGNSYYNDHHYHYGYFVYSAAILAFLNKGISPQLNDAVNSLIRDVANPSIVDPYFPVFRFFDFWAGHSWSRGLFGSADGKDQESASEEVNFLHGCVLFGKYTNNIELETRSKLLMAVQKRSVNKYFYIKNDNVVHPPSFITHKVTGIYFENKCDYATWFSANFYCIHGIQMLPATTAVVYLRESVFVQEEWAFLDSQGVNSIPDEKWLGILMTNYARLNSADAYNRILNMQSFDDGLTKTWSLFWAKSLSSNITDSFFTQSSAVGQGNPGIPAAPNTKFQVNFAF